MGRALLHLKRHGVDGVEDLVLDAGRHSYVFDAQVDFTGRAEWLARVLEAGGIGDRAVPLLIADLGAARSCDDDLGQVCDILTLLAQRGSAAAGDALREAYPKWSNCVLLTEAQIRLDGEAGWLRVAAAIGAHLRNGRNQPEDDHGLWIDSALADAEDALGEERADEILREAAGRDEDVRAFREALRRQDGAAASAPRRDRPEPTAEAILAAVRSDASRVDLRILGRNAEPDALRAVFDAYCEEQDTERLRRFLAVFTTTGLPELDVRTLGLTEHEDRTLRNRATAVLGRTRDPRVRSYALEALGTKSGAAVPDRSVSLLLRNYEPGDHRFIEPHVAIGSNDTGTHHIVSALQGLFEEHPRAELAPLALWAYEESPCAMCRRLVVHALEAAALAPGWLLEEWPHDVGRCSSDDEAGESI